VGTTAAVGVGVIGRGFGRRVVAPVFEETDGCEVVDLVSPRDEAAVRALCARPDVDLVAVHSPPFLHRDHVLWAVEQGKAVLCDKPFGRGAADAIAMETAARDARTVAFLNFEFRQHPGRATLRALVHEGAIGTVEHVQWSAFASGSRVPMRWHGWLFDAAQGGGWIGAWGSHAIDFLLWTFGDIVDAHADLRTTVAERPDRDGVMHPSTAEDGFTAWMHTAGGATITIDTSYVARVNVPTRITVLGSEGALESVGDGRIVLRTDDGSTEAFTFDAPAEDPHLVPMRAWAEIVRDSVRSGQIPDDVPTFVDGVACARVMDSLRGVRA
jgi:predicted dehydrogenase